MVVYRNLNPVLVPLLLLIVITFNGWAGNGLAQEYDSTLDPKSPIHNLKLPGESFEVAGHRAFILWPRENNRTKPQPWIMYAPAMAAFPDAHERWMHEQFLEAGIAVAGIDMGEAYGSPTGNAGMTALYDELVARGFEKRLCLLGRSRGGLWASSWAAANPEKVSGIIAIYPVFDFRTYPGLEAAAAAFQLSPAELDRRALEFNPIHKANILAEAKIPMAIIHGDIDTVVPLRENSQTMADAYKAAGAEHLLHLEVVVGQGHNYWEGFFRSQHLVDFAIQWAKTSSR